LVQAARSEAPSRSLWELWVAARLLVGLDLEGRCADVRHPDPDRPQSG
jgi:hypothetical protein